MKIIFILFISLFLAFCFLVNTYLPFIFLVFFLYLWLLFKYPEIGLFLVILVANDFFSLVSGDAFRLPGIFRIKDIFFIASFAPLLHLVFKRKIKFRPCSIAKAIWVIIGLVILEIILTMVIRNQSFSYTIRMARRYLYYFFYFPLVYLIDTEIKFQKFLKLLIISALIFSTLMLVQLALGPSRVIFKYASHVIEQEIAGEHITRSYALGGQLAIIVFYIFLFGLFFGTRNKIARLFVTVFTFFGGVFVGFSRANFIGVITGGLFAALNFMRLRKNLKILAFSVICLSFLFLTFEGAHLVIGKSFSNPLYLVYKGVESAAQDFTHKTGTFGFRLKDSAERISLIKKNPVFGIGFVHPLSEIIKIRTLTSGIVTADSGIITLLLDFGLVGLIWLFCLTFAFFKKAKKLYMTVNDDRHRILIMSAFAFYFGRLFSFMTLADFTTYDGIVSICLALFILTYLERLNCDRTLDNNCKL